MSKRLVASVFLALVLSACSALNSANYQAFPLLLLPPSDGPESAIYKQRLELISASKSSQLLVVLKIDKSEIRLRGLLPTGQSLYAIDYDGQQVNQQSLSAEALPAEEILTMLQFALWPEDVLLRFYKASDDWSMEIDSDYRRLSLNGIPKLQVSYFANEQLMLENFAHQYKVKIETLEYKRL